MKDLKTMVRLNALDCKLKNIILHIRKRFRKCLLRNPCFLFPALTAAQKEPAAEGVFPAPIFAACKRRIYLTKIVRINI